MATCRLCKKDMLKVGGCERTRIVFPKHPGERRVVALLQIPNGAETCHDCGAKPGRFHHPGCDMERCPKCSGQLIGCGCLRVFLTREVDHGASG